MNDLVASILASLFVGAVVTILLIALLKLKEESCKK
jgi:hypothetical protein